MGIIRLIVRKATILSPIHDSVPVVGKTRIFKDKSWRSGHLEPLQRRELLMTNSTQSFIYDPHFSISNVSPRFSSNSEAFAS